MTGRFTAVVLTLLAAFAVLPANTAPLPPFRPVDLCGTVRSANWLPPLVRPPIKGMSGSAGHERKWPGRFVVVLDGVTGIGPENFRLINTLLTTSRDGASVALAPGELLLVLPFDDPGYLSDAAAICVTGFVIRGDEGG
ncbi:MAG: hypothetical protein WAU86_09640, partial [Oricola sp.]